MSDQEKTDVNEIRKKISSLAHQIKRASPSRSADLAIELEEAVDEFMKIRQEIKKGT